MLKLPQDYVVVDVETTGLRPWQGDRVVEIGALRVERGKVAGKFWQLVNPGRPIPPEAQRIHGITDADVAGQPVMAEVLPQFFSFTSALPLVAHYAAFDRSFIESACQACGLAHPVRRYLCTVELSRYVNPHLPRHNLDALAHYYGITVSDRHRALGDVEATWQLYEMLRRMCERAPRARPFAARPV
ncbi:MAG: 3'-5' exonuclease [Patescibacteria group bacterium]|nr:3'-5' exonuclease [Patescibacteria group bacterium]